MYAGFETGDVRVRLLVVDKPNNQHEVVACEKQSSGKIFRWTVVRNYIAEVSANFKVTTSEEFQYKKYLSTLRTTLVDDDVLQCLAHLATAVEYSSNDRFAMVTYMLGSAVNDTLISLFYNDV